MEAFQYGALVSKRVADVLRVHGRGGVVAEEVGVLADHAGHDLEGHFQHLGRVDDVARHFVHGRVVGLRVIVVWGDTILLQAAHSDEFGPLLRQSLTKCRVNVDEASAFWMAKRL